MSENHWEDVANFHRKFGLPEATTDPGPHHIPQSNEAARAMVKFRIKFMQEELQEFIDGFEDEDIAQMADALIDLEYVVLGTSHMLGLPHQELWDDVQAANMRKERASADGSNSKRGSALDVIKPAGWVGPDGASILKTHGYNA